MWNCPTAKNPQTACIIYVTDGSAELFERALLRIRLFPSPINPFAFASEFIFFCVVESDKKITILVSQKHTKSSRTSLMKPLQLNLLYKTFYQNIEMCFFERKNKMDLEFLHHRSDKNATDDRKVFEYCANSLYSACNILFYECYGLQYCVL